MLEYAPNSVHNFWSLTLSSRVTFLTAGHLIVSTLLEAKKLARSQEGEDKQHECCEKATPLFLAIINKFPLCLTVSYN
jgi:hypothetical protein